MIIIIWVFVLLMKYYTVIKDIKFRIISIYGARAGHGGYPKYVERRPKERKYEVKQSLEFCIK